LRDAGLELSRLVRAGRMAEAQALYTRVTGDAGSQPCTQENVWWFFCADHRIYTHAPRAVEMAVKELGEGYTAKQLAYAECRAAQRLYGGTWSVYWEY
jgi:hypothetical protein